MAAAPSTRARRFAAACGVLSRCVKAAETERAAEARPAAAVAVIPLPLMPGADVSVQDEHAVVGTAPAAAEVAEAASRPAHHAHAQMTIFYGGRVVVLDEFPADRAAEVLRLAAAAAAGAARGSGQGEAADDDLLPMARKASLQRFMEKRKGHLAARGVPYRRQVDGAGSCGDHLTLAL